MITVTEIKNGTQVHTCISGDLKKVVAAMSKTTKVPQSVIFNTAISRGLAGMTTASASPEVTRGSFKKPKAKVVKKRKATPAKKRK